MGACSVSVYFMIGFRLPTIWQISGIVLISSTRIRFGSQSRWLVPKYLIKIHDTLFDILNNCNFFATLCCAVLCETCRFQLNSEVPLYDFVSKHILYISITCHFRSKFYAFSNFRLIRSVVKCHELIYISQHSVRILCNLLFYGK